MTDPRTLMQELSALVATPEAGDEAAIARLEDVLTSGYAHALALEAENLRLEQRLGEAARRLGRNGVQPQDVTALAEQLSSAEGDLTDLRSLLSVLRERTSAARAAALGTT